MHNLEKPLGVSVIICCYNSAAVLPETLTSIAAQEVPLRIPWEVIIINNNSNDNTTNIATMCWQETGAPAAFKIVDEPNPGLSFAREKGFKTATYEYMLLCDDDNWLRSDYVQRAYAVMYNNPEIGVAGGRGEAICEGGEPSWFKAVQEQFATGRQALIAGDVSKSKKYVFGAGAIVRNSAYQFVKAKGFKSLLTDRKGQDLASGGDNELCYIMILGGYKIWYDDELYYQHFLKKGRLTWSYLQRLNKAFAKTAFYLRPYTYHLSRTPFPRQNIWLRDLRHLLKQVPVLTWQYYKAPRHSDLKKLAQIRLQSHLELMRIYVKERHRLDEAIASVAQLANQLKQ